MESEVRNRKAKQSPSSVDKSSTRKSTKKSAAAHHVDDRLSSEECGVDDDSLDEQQQKQQQQQSPSVCQNERVQRSSDEPAATVQSATTNSADNFRIQVHLDLMTIALFVVAFGTRIYRLSEPKNIV